ncbi:outer membrane protein assembly factor BamE [Pseudomonas sp. C27(2019)]|uniref:outer membrane protein assembly factor BamE n=1 Tax=Pseudomonas sp. C27(2019) TaxID=2604941 RepID=UPI0012478092|nr:outer membrane protein assembly factor BamE [Pseudomonas sp. C27(2019)]QEY59247.1 outer membrane protein assembly factor BamE [Pseudomonas sp. C27(2019)]
MQNSSRIIRSFTLASLLVLAGCSFPGVHKIDIQQGNVVTQDMVDQLRPGMTTRQVRFIMGTPLIADTFNSNRWDYLYSIQLAGGTRKQERISLIFNDDNQLQGLGGDFLPGVSRDQAILGQSSTTSSATDARTAQTEPSETQERIEPPVPGSLQEQIQREVDEMEAAPIPESRLENGEL